MIPIGNNDKLLSMGEALSNVREHIKNNQVDDDGIAIYASCLAVALREDVDYVRGAIK